MVEYTTDEKMLRLQKIIHAEIADCNDPEARESPAFSNRGPFVDAALRSIGLPPGNKWCMAYQYMRFEEAGMIDFNGITLLTKTGLVQAQVNHFKNNGLLIHAQDAQAAAKAGRPIVKPGYLVFEFFPEHGRYAHVELIESIGEHGDFQAIGGNQTTVSWARESDRVCANARNLYDRKAGVWRFAFGQTH